MMAAEIKNIKAFYNTEIPSGWEVKELGKIALVNMGQSPDSENYNEIEEGLPLIQGNADIRNRKSFKRYFTTQLTKVCDEGDLILSVRAPVGSIGEASFKSCIGRGVCALKPNKVDKEYLYQLLLNSEDKWKKIEQGSTFTAVSSDDVRKFKLLVPKNEAEQKAIAKVLCAADAAIHTTEKLIAQKELRKKWLIQQLLTGKKRLKGFDGEWKEKKLSDLFDRVTRKNTEGNTTVVTISAQRGFVRQTDFFNKNIASEITDNYFLVERGEFCYNKSYSNGYPWGATKRLNDFDKAVVTTLYICFGVKDEKKTNPQYFEQYFGANHLDKGLTKIAHEGGRAHGLLNVTPSDFFSLKVTVPSFEEQTAIAQVLQAADKEISLLKAKAEKLREQKKGLMQVLLTGKVRLKIK